MACKIEVNLKSIWTTLYRDSYIEVELYIRQKKTL